MTDTPYRQDLTYPARGRSYRPPEMPECVCDPCNEPTFWHTMSGAGVTLRGHLGSRRAAPPGRRCRRHHCCLRVVRQCADRRRTVRLRRGSSVRQPLDLCDRGLRHVSACGPGHRTPWGGAPPSDPPRGGEHRCELAGRCSSVGERQPPAAPSPPDRTDRSSAPVRQPGRDADARCSREVHSARLRKSLTSPGPGWLVIWPSLEIPVARNLSVLHR